MVFSLNYFGELPRNFRAAAGFFQIKRAVTVFFKEGLKSQRERERKRMGRICYCYCRTKTAEDNGELGQHHFYFFFAGNWTGNCLFSWLIFAAAAAFVLKCFTFYFLIFFALC